MRTVVRLDLGVVDLRVDGGFVERDETEIAGLVAQTQIAVDVGLGDDAGRLQLHRRLAQIQIAPHLVLELRRGAVLRIEQQTVLIRVEFAVDLERRVAHDLVADRGRGDGGAELLVRVQQQLLVDHAIEHLALALRRVERGGIEALTQHALHLRAVGIVALAERLLRNLVAVDHGDVAGVARTVDVLLNAEEAAEGHRDQDQHAPGDRAGKLVV